jgi:hypothetical protein
MAKEYIVRLSEQEHNSLLDITKELKGTSQKVKRANILLKANVEGPNWPDAKIAEALSCRIRTIENVRRRLVTEGLDAVVNRKQRQTPPTPKILDGKQEAQIIALRLGRPPAGFANWTLRLLADQVVQLEIADKIRYQTVRRTLKKTA